MQARTKVAGPSGGSGDTQYVWSTPMSVHRPDRSGPVSSPPKVRATICGAATKSTARTAENTSPTAARTRVRR